jgi:hypothetical protein
MPHKFSTSYREDSISLLHYYKKLGDGAMAQVSDADLPKTLDAESNFIAVIVKHLSGNMRSRFTDFLTSDGEKPDRNRDGEFERPSETREEILALWESGWKIVFDALAPLHEADVTRSVNIRSEPHSVLQAVNRQVAHYAYRVGQMVFIAKHLAGDRWHTLSVPRGKSVDFTARVKAGEASQR